MVGEGRGAMVASPGRGGPGISPAVAAIEHARKQVERVGHALALGTRQRLEERRIGVAPPRGHAVGRSFATRGESHVGLTTVVGAPPANDVAPAL